MQDITTLGPIPTEAPGIEALVRSVTGTGRKIGLRGAPRLSQALTPYVYWRESGVNGENKLIFLFRHKLSRSLGADASPRSGAKDDLYGYTVDELNVLLRKELAMPNGVPFRSVAQMLVYMDLCHWGMCVNEASHGADKFRGSVMLAGRVPHACDHVKDLIENPRECDARLVLEMYRDPEAAIPGRHPAPLQLCVRHVSELKPYTPRESPLIMNGDTTVVSEPGVAYVYGRTSYVMDPREQYRVHREEPVFTLDVLVRLADKTRLS